jgi:uncharacterized protein (DUF362 family)
MSRVIVVRGKDPREMVPKGLENLPRPSKDRVVIKPNLINTEAPPTTTPYRIVEALVRYYHDYDVVIAEGSGWCDTFHAYRALGYLKAEEYGVSLVDLNRDGYELREDSEALVLRGFEFPSTLKDSYIISAPVLKEHSITDVTISLKNMLGAAIGEKAGVAKKDRFHRLGIDESIVDVNLYLRPSLAVVDGIAAGLGGELRARAKELGVMIFSEDLVAADAVGAGLLGYDPLSVRHLRLAQERGLGIADPEKIEVVEVE